MKKIQLALLSVAFLLVSCADMGGTFNSGSNYLSFENAKVPIAKANVILSDQNYTFELYSDAQGKHKGYHIILSFPNTLNDTLFMLPLPKEPWSVEGSVEGIDYSGDRSGRIGFQSMNVQIKTIDGAGTYELMFSLALEDSRCMKGYYKGRVN